MGARRSTWILRDSNEVLAYNGPRTKVTVQVRTRGVWRLVYQRPDRHGSDEWIHGLGDGMKELQVPRSGWLIAEVPDGGSWSVQTPA